MSDGNNSSTGGLGARLIAALAGRIAWLTDLRRDGSGENSNAPALVVLLGREHYSERRRAYPISARRDLDAVLRQELTGRPPTLTLIGGTRDDKREVAFFELKPDALARAGRCLWLVPESVALAATLPAQGIASVERAGLRYFVAANGVSQVAAGAVTTPELFAFAAGLEGGEATSIAADGLRARLLAGLGRLPLDAWLRLRVPSLRPRLALDWRPLLTMAGIGLVGYLALASAYLTVAQNSRERALAGLGSEVERLLSAQRDVDQMLAQQQALAVLTADRRYSYRLWQAAAVAWGKGAAISAVQLADTTLILRGDAEVATDVLAALAAVPGFADAKFSAPVRRSQYGREEFSIALTLQQETDRG